MSGGRKKSSAGTLLEQWRPPREAGEPLGCLSTTYTFSPALFDEQCLARFLGIEAEPDREDLAFLLERESRLGSVYAGVLVDHTQAGVEHSLRWDVLPVRIRGGKQHAKISLLAWTNCLRIVVASGNLTEPGYRTNFEVAGSVDSRPGGCHIATVTAALEFLRGLLEAVPGPANGQVEVERALTFLDRVEVLAGGWKAVTRRGTVRQQLVFNLPPSGKDQSGHRALSEAIAACRTWGGSPETAWVASPFFDANDESGRVVAELCKSMARGRRREVRFAVPAAARAGAKAPPRLMAPRALLRVPHAYSAAVGIDTLPLKDGDGNARPWHAKMYRFAGESYSALLIGSSNFTCAGLGIGIPGNAEANLLTLVEKVAYAREAGQLEAAWPTVEGVEAPESAEWLGASPDPEEEEQTKPLSVPPGFLSAIYFAGDARRLVLALDPERLPEVWTVFTCGRKEAAFVGSSDWVAAGRPREVGSAWAPVEPPTRLRVSWEGNDAFFPVNVADSAALPPPAKLEQMSADDMLMILAAVDPGAATRWWAKKQEKEDSETYDPDIDSASPVDLDPLRRFELKATFLHRIRRRARILAQLRANLQRPVWGRQALEWRLHGMIGIEALAARLVRELGEVDGRRDEALLTLADFLIVLREVDYQPQEGALSKREFESAFRPFLSELAQRLGQAVVEVNGQTAEELLAFWRRVEERCQS